MDRLAALLVLLQSRRVVKGSEIAARFGVSLRTVYRDIRTLEAGGMPIVGEAGVGYGLVQGYRLAPILFTTDEALALLTAEKLVAQLTDKATGAHIAQALDKIRAVLPSREQAVLEQLEDRIEVLPGRAHRHQAPVPSWLPLILRSTRARRVVAFRYFSAYRNATGQRRAEPLGVFFLDGYWHLIAWCLEKAAYRDFRLDRMADVVVTETPFERHHPPLAEYLQAHWYTADGRPAERVVIRVQAAEAHYLETQKYYHGFTHQVEGEGYIEMHFLVHWQEYFVRWYAMFADDAEIVEPPALAERMRAYVQTLAARYGANVTAC